MKNAIILALPWLFDNVDSKVEYRFLYLSNYNVISSSGRSLALKRKFDYFQVLNGRNLGLATKIPKNGLKIFPEFLEKCYKNLRFHL